LWTVRFHLHYVAGRAEERLTFDMQPVVGARMGYTRHGKQDGVERFMRHYFLNARDIARLTRILEPAILRAALGPPAIEAETDKSLLDAGFVLAEGKLLPMTGRDFDTDPIQMLRVLIVARDRGLELHPLALRMLIRSAPLAADLRVGDVVFDPRGGDFLAALNPEQLPDARHRRVPVSPRVLRQELVRHQPAVRPARHDVGERPAPIDPEIPQSVHPPSVIGPIRPRPARDERPPDELPAGPFHHLAGPFTTSRGTDRDKSRSYSRVLVKGPGKW